MWMIIAAALAPVVLLLGYIWYKDIKQPEPLKWILKALWYGVLSTVLVLVVVAPIPEFEVTGPITAFMKAFLYAAMPEEGAKLLLLWLLLRKNPFFDERLDGIVYATCVALGFAGLENILYLLGGMDDGSWLTLGISRGIFAVPGHFFFGTLMGYFFARAWFGNPANRSKNMFLAWLVPTIAHGIYDGILFTMGTVEEWIAGVLFILFLVGFGFMRRRSVKAITTLQTEDTNETIMDLPDGNGSGDNQL